MLNIFPTPQEANSRLDTFINDKLEKYFEKNVLPNYHFTHNDLNKKVNEDETLLEYIRYSEVIYGLNSANVELMSDIDLNKYVMKLDLLWAYAEQIADVN